jgi:hypothetical protein
LTFPISLKQVRISSHSYLNWQLDWRNRSFGPPVVHESFFFLCQFCLSMALVTARLLCCRGHWPPH